MTPHDLVTARISLMTALTDTSHLLLIAKIRRREGLDTSAWQYIDMAINRLERAHAIQCGGQVPTLWAPNRGVREGA